MRQRPDKQKQQGLVTLVVTLVILVALSILSVVGARVALVKQRTATNNVEAIQAAAAADAGLQAAEAYLKANRMLVISAEEDGWLNSNNANHWNLCDANNAALPCVYARDNLNGNGWGYYKPDVGILPSFDGKSKYQYDLWYLSRSFSTGQLALPGCQTLGLGGVLSPVLDLVNGILTGVQEILKPVFGLLVGDNDILSYIQLPTLPCLPIYFSQQAAGASDYSNPVVYILAQAEANSGHTTRARSAVQLTGAFKHAPVASITAAGDASMLGDVRIWGNPRPPTQDPINFSTLNLMDSLNVLDILDLGDLVNFLTTGLDTILDPLLYPVLSALLSDPGTNKTRLLSNLNVTFPLSIWADGYVTLSPQSDCERKNGEECNVDVDEVADGPGGYGGLLGPVLNVLTDLMGGRLSLNDLLQSARTCLPKKNFNDGCTPLSQTITVLKGTYVKCGLLGETIGWLEKLFGSSGCNDGFTDDSTGLSVNLKLPDVQDGSPTLQGLVTESVLNSHDAPEFPNALMEFTFGASNEQVKNAAVNNSCNNIRPGINWINGDCNLSNEVGSSAEPVILVMNGDLTLNEGAYINGVIYMTADCGATIFGPTDEDDERATIRGGLVMDSESSCGKSSQIRGAVNVVYNNAVIRKAGLLAGGLAPVRGSWNDAWDTP